MFVDSWLEKDGKVKRVTIFDDSGNNAEKLLVYNKSELYGSYTVKESPMPVSDYKVTLSVKDGLEENAIVTWEAEFLAERASDKETDKRVRNFLKEGIDNLK